MMRNLTTCVPYDDDLHRPGFIIGFRYDLDTVEELKRRIPHTHRSWDADNKTWWISKEYETVLLKLFRNFAAFKAQTKMF